METLNNIQKITPPVSPSLPQPGGAITGMGSGQNHTIDGFTGSFSNSAGGLVYNSGAGNGPFGMGHGRADSGGISRRTTHGTPTYDDNTDTFMMGGAVLLPKLDKDAKQIIKSGSLAEVTINDEKWKKAMVDDSGLIDKDHPYSVRIYIPRLISPGGFSKIQYWKWEDSSTPEEGTPLSFWRIIGTDNSCSLFGVSTDAQISNPNSTAQIYRWLPEESLSASGHSALSYYLSENTDGVNTLVAPEKGHVQTAQKYIHRMCSGHQQPIPEPLSFLNASVKDQREPAWYFETVYNYGQYNFDPSNSNPYQIPEGNTWSKRADSFSHYSAGFEIRTHRLCHEVGSFVRFENE